MILRFSLALALSALALPPAPRGADEAEAGAEFAESVEVREIEVRFDDSVLPRIESIGRRADSDFAVLCDGVELPAVNGPAASPPELDAIPRALWFDPALAPPATLAAAARRLAEAAPALAGGSVEIVAIPGRRWQLPAGSSTALAELLHRLAGEWDASSGGRSSAEERARALDRLAIDRYDRPVEGGALFVAVGGVEVDAAQLNEISRLSNPANHVPPAALDDSPLARYELASRLLAAAGWTTFAVAPRELPDAERDLLRAREAETREVGGDEQHRFPLFRIGVTPRSPHASVAIDLALDLTLAPWKQLVRGGSGTLVAEAGMIGYDLVRVANRRRLVVRPPERAPGALARLEVRWSGGDGRDLPSLRGLRAGTPPEAAAARLRAIATNDLELDARTSARFEPGLGGDEPTRICLPGSEPARWLRISSLGSEPDARPDVGPALPLAPGEAPCAALCRPDSEGAPCARTDRPGLHFLVEEIESGAWAALRMPDGS